jgi:hypothetical protein
MENLRLFQRMRTERGARLPQLRLNHVLSEMNIDQFDSFLALVSEIKPEKIGVRTVSRMSEAVIQESSDPAFSAKVRVARVRLAEFCDCLNCVIRRGAGDPDDDFFYRKVAKPLEGGASLPQRSRLRNR